VGRDIDDVASDATWNRDARHETATERLDRNWADLLQELRVVQTGVQLLTGLLLTVPFQARFTDLSDFQQNVYLLTVATSVASTALLIAPVALHRVLFRQHARRLLIRFSQRSALAGLALLAMAVIGVVVLIFDLVTGRTGAVLAGVAALVLFGSLWGLVPVILRRTCTADRRDRTADHR
jgi:hypothetical protein